jgi:hypothetical protein
MFTSRLTGFKLSWTCSLVKFLFSFCLALLTEASLLALASISSLKALETVSFNSLFFVPAFKVFLSLFSSPLNLFVALCSANFLLSKSFATGGDLGANDGFAGAPLLNEEVVFGLKVLGLEVPALIWKFASLFFYYYSFFSLSFCNLNIIERFFGCARYC